MTELLLINIGVLFPPKTKQTKNPYLHLPLQKRSHSPFPSTDMLVHLIALKHWDLSEAPAPSHPPSPLWVSSSAPMSSITIQKHTLSPSLDLWTELQWASLITLCAHSPEYSTHSCGHTYLTEHANLPSSSFIPHFRQRYRHHPPRMEISHCHQFLPPHQSPLLTDNTFCQFCFRKVSQIQTHLSIPLPKTQLRFRILW